jgi:hypothetical protein
VSHRNGQIAANDGVLFGAQNRHKDNQTDMRSKKWMVRLVQCWLDRGSRNHWSYCFVAHESTEGVYLGVETAKIERSRCEGHRRVDLVFGHDSRLIEGAGAGPDRDNHMKQEAVANEAGVGNSAGDNRLEVDN